MIKAPRGAAIAVLAAASVMTLTACQSLDASGSSNANPDTLTVGFVTPLTGPLAAFGAPDKFVVDQMQSYFDKNPIQAGDKDYKVTIILKDSQSDATRAGQVAQDLITQDGADVLLAHATPDTTVPVAKQCEANAIPCITADTPWQPWAFSLQADPEKPEPLKWAHHFFWGLEDIASVYQDMWNQVDTNKKVAGLFPNDADGTAWSGALPGMFEQAGNGYTLDVPSLYDPGTTDFSALINKFIANDNEILTGVVPPPDFAAFWQQAQQLGYHPKVVTIAKAIEFPAAIDSFENPVGLTTEVWWSPTSPYTSNLTGQSAQELADAYEEDSGDQWTVALGFSEALFEVLAQSVSDAGSIDGAAISQAIGTMKIDTIVGPLDWANGPYPNVAKSPLVGGMWVKGSGKFPYSLEVVADPGDSGVPVVGTVQPLSN